VQNAPVLEHDHAVAKEHVRVVLPSDDPAAFDDRFASGSPLAISIRSLAQKDSKTSLAPVLPSLTPLTTMAWVPLIEIDSSPARSASKRLTRRKT
jgi:hypothetical protein